MAGLAACGGDPASVATPVLTEVPVAAAATPAAYTEFVQQQSATETADPLSLDTFATAPGNESDDPVVLN
ncbi:MAG: hypothetical protein H7Z15_00455 [Rhizobacter sp.]|nr:hypothetical protein [Rhizobacter sp.]